MIARYKRTARTFSELQLGYLASRDEALAELTGYPLAHGFCPSCRRALWRRPPDVQRNPGTGTEWSPYGVLHAPCREEDNYPNLAGYFAEHLIGELALNRDNETWRSCGL